MLSVPTIDNGRFGGRSGRARDEINLPVASAGSLASSRGSATTPQHPQHAAISILISDTTTKIAGQSRRFVNRDNLAVTDTIFPVPPASHQREPVIINVPPPDASTPHRRFKGEIEHFENKVLVLVADEAVDVAVLISAHGKDLMFLGSVLNCSAEPDGRWTIQVKVNRTLLVV